MTNVTAFLEIALAGGRLRGRRTAGGANFLGIPYAAAPVGSLRWRPPQPAPAWTGVRDALAFGPDAPQAPGAALRAQRQDEDCLYLNLWTPTTDASARLPVLVWLHGGGFSGGSGSEAMCDGASLAAEGAVVVTVNYRCGLFGFLAHPELSRESEHGVSGNYGLLDQMAALRWVGENIGAFGGDPQRVTAFGYSAGSASISLMLASPRCAGLFQRAILQSPGAARPLASLQQAESAGSALGDLASLREQSTQDMLAKTSLLTPKVRGLTTPRVLRPIRDGWLIPEDERPAFQAGRIHAMPLLVGSNADEGSLLTRAWPVDSLAAWREQVDLNFGALAQEAASLYPARTDADARARVAEMFADTQFNYGTRLLAQAMAAREPRTWRYVFLRGNAAGAPQHGDEAPYVFGTLPRDASPEDRELSRTMRLAWVAFAASGDPNGAGLPAWPRHETSRDNFLALDVPARVGERWRGAQLDFLERFFSRK